MASGKKGLIGVAVVALLAGVFVIGRATIDTPAVRGLIIKPQPVTRRTLSDVLTVNGVLRRDETQKLNSPVDGKVSKISANDGDTINAGDPIFSLDGRTAYAVNGDFSFYRKLDVGSVGPDVLQLETILNDQGYLKSKPNDLYTEETRSALAKWQLDRGYPGATPEPDESVTVGLTQNSAGYKVAKDNTVSFTIVPSAPVLKPAAGLARALHAPKVVTKPTINVSVSSTTVNEGGTFALTFTSDIAPTSDMTMGLTIGGSATGGTDPTNGDDYSTINGDFIFPAGQTSVTLDPVKVFNDQVIENAEDITVQLTVQFGNDPNYIVGPVDRVRVTIAPNGSDLQPVFTIDTDTADVDEGQQVTFTVRSTVESNVDQDFTVDFGGTADSGTDFVPLDKKTFTIRAGQTSVGLNVQIRKDNLVEVDESLTISLGPDPDTNTAHRAYTIGSPSTARVTIKSNDLPIMHVTGGGVVREGAKGSFQVVADAPVTDDTSINYQVGGTATEGSDYNVLSGTAIMKAGTSSVTIPLNVINDDVQFLPSDMLVAKWPARVGKVNVDEGEFVLQGAPVITLTEPVFTITMKVSPSDRAQLKVGQPAKVKLKAGDQELTGTITSLDDAAKVGDAGEELYEGVVEVKGELAAVDGASVTIDVTLAEKTDVLSVPVAAVLRSTDGDQVRVVNDQGTITRVPVTIGLIDNEFVEIVKGLKGNELVVVDVDAAGTPAAGG
ncbi:MAG: Calx-beta domain-containing protein [Actinomycetota bacterium]